MAKTVLKALVSENAATFTMQQDALFYDSFNAALVQVVNCLGGPMVVGRLLWPTKSASYCETKCANCLNPKHDWKFELEELITILLLARKAGIHFGIAKLCEEIGYAAPDVLIPKTKRQELAEKKLRNAQEAKQIADEEAALDRSEGVAPLRSMGAMR